MAVKYRGRILGIAVYQCALALVLFYYIVKLWPQAPLSDTTAFEQTTVPFIVFEFSVTNEVRMILLVLFIGAEGTVAHCLRSLWLHSSVRNDFRPRWTGWYLTRPAMGAILAFGFYLLLRAGLVSYGSSGSTPSLYGFAAIALLVGIFSEETFEKLKSIAENVFEKAKPFEESITGEYAPDDGDYVVVAHLEGNACAKPHEFQTRKEGELLMACPNCKSNVRWKYLE